MNEKPNYYAIIPANVRYDNELKDKAKLLYGEITSLSTKDGYCYASNKYFANLYDVSTTTISLLIKNLIDRGYIESEIIYKEGTKEILNRYLKIIKDPYLKNLKYPIKEKLKDNNININNTRINNTSINKKEIYKEKYFENEKTNEIFLEFLEIRKKIKAVNSEIAIKRIINKLSQYDDNIKYLMIEKSVINSWKDVYPLKENEISKEKKDVFRQFLEEEENEKKRNTYDAIFTENSIS